VQPTERTSFKKEQRLKTKNNVRRITPRFKAKNDVRKITRFKAKNDGEREPERLALTHDQP
jgi:hypothetical protein